MNVKQALKKLEALGNEKMRKHNLKHGSGDNQFGVRRGEVGKLAKEIKVDHELALKLWETENIDARFLAILLMEPYSLSAKELNQLVRSLTFVEVEDWLSNYVIKKHAEKESLRVKWMKTKHPMAARAGWRLTAERIAKSPEGLDVEAILDRIESEMATAKPEPQWTMNFALAEVGINLPKLRKRALAIGEKHGIYSDWPTVKGCTSPFAPVWINEMVSRQK